ncbi:hypothetical protein Tco_1376893 [Tanacetum coccineum]
MDHECFNLQNDEFEEKLKAQRIKNQGFLDTFKELCDMFLLSAWFLLLVDSFCWLNTFMLLELFMLPIHLFMLLNCFCCAQFDIAGWMVSATSHLVSAGSLQSCWCNTKLNNGTITMTAVKAMTKQQLIEEYEYICRRLEKDRLLSAQYNLFRPKPAITKPPSKRQRVEHVSSQTAFVPADDPDSAGGGSSNPAGSAFGTPVTDSTVPTPAVHEIGVSPFADSAASSSPSNVSTDHIPLDVLFESTSGGINDFFLESDEEEQISMSRIAADLDSDDEVLAEIIFRGKFISGDDVVFVDELPDDEIVAPRVKVETVFDYASSPPRVNDDDMEHYIPPLPYGEFKDWEMVSCPPGNNHIHVYYQQNRRRKYFRLNPDVDVGIDLWRDINLLCQSLHSDDVEDFWRTQDEWIVSSWKLYPKSSVHVLDLTNGKTVYMFVDKFYPIRATLLERMLRHRLTVPPSYCRDVVVAGSVIQTVQTSLRQSYECLASAPFACTARQMVFSSPWLTAKKESGSPLQTALWLVQEGTALGKDSSNPLMVARFLLFIEFHAVSIDAADLGCCFDGFLLLVLLLLDTLYLLTILIYVIYKVVPAGSSSSVPADYVSAGHLKQGRIPKKYRTGNGYSLKDKNEAKTDNQAQDWKEREKSKPKTYAS